MHESRSRASKTPAFLSGLMAYTGEPQHAKSRNARSFASRRTRSCIAARRTHIGGSTHAKAKLLSLMKAALKLWSVYANKTRSFVRRLQIAVEMGDEFFQLPWSRLPARAAPSSIICVPTD